MKKIFLLIIASFAFLSAFSVLPPLITQEEADNIVLQRLSQETLNYFIYAKEGVQTEMIITTGAIGSDEELELDYPCWVYYARYPITCYGMHCFFGRYLIVNASNGNLLEVNKNMDAGPSDLAEWREIAVAIPFSAAKMTNSVNQFSMEFFATAHEELRSDENIVLSPLSLNMALAMVWNGAKGDTKQGIQQAMGMQNYAQDDVNSYFLDLRQKLTTADADVKLALANSIWYDESFPVKSDFITVNKDYYDAEVSEIDFRAPDAADQINGWCSDNTNGLIKSMIDEIPASAVMYLINALYFKGLWTDDCGFDPERTHQTYFRKENGENVLIDMMEQGREDIDYYSDEHLEMVTLPYGNGAYSMVFVLPKGDFGTMLQQLKQPDYWQNCLSNLQSQVALLYIPKFKVEYEPNPNLNNILIKLGMGKAFTGTADFSGIADAGLSISEVRQKTYIEVDEKGTEAAAVTMIGMTTGEHDPIPYFYANRPFLFVIQENTTGTMLFMGKVGNP